jgi:four helix bundle protein
MHPKAEQLQDRTRTFAARVIAFCDALPSDVGTRKMTEQLVDSAGSTDSNYRAACRARSLKEFIAKIGLAAEEADESKGWLLLLVRSSRAKIEETRPLIQEADELVAIFVASRKTAIKRLARQQSARRPYSRSKPPNRQ